MTRKFKKFDYVLAKGNEGRALEIAEAMEKSGFKIWGKRQGYKFGKWDAIAIDHCGDIIRCRTTDPACQNLVEFAQEGQVTLAPGDYISTAGMTEDQYHAGARAFMAAGAASAHFNRFVLKHPMSTWKFIGWGKVTGNLNGENSLRKISRHLTISQVLNATNAGNKEEDMTPCEKLGYKVGDVFEYTGGIVFPKGGKIRLSEDDGTNLPMFHGIDCNAYDGDDWAYARIGDIKRIDGTTDPLTNTLQSAREEADKATEHEAKAAQHRDKHDELMQQAREMLPDGWMLVRGGVDWAKGEDLADPANWKQGDQLECVKSWKFGTKGKIYKVGNFNRAGYRRKDEGVLAIPVSDDDGDNASVAHHYFRFHHRPT